MFDPYERVLVTMIARSFSDIARETLCSFPLVTVFLARNIRYSRYNYVLGEAGRWVEECMYGSSLQWVDSLKQRILAAKRYFKADHKLHVSEESPCTDHCVRFARTHTPMLPYRRCSLQVSL